MFEWAWVNFWGSMRGFVHVYRDIEGSGGSALAEPAADRSKGLEAGGTCVGPHSDDTKSKKIRPNQTKSNPTAYNSFTILLLTGDN